MSRLISSFRPLPRHHVLAVPDCGVMAGSFTFLGRQPRSPQAALEAFKGIKGLTGKTALPQAGWPHPCHPTILSYAAYLPSTHQQPNTLLTQQVPTVDLIPQLTLLTLWDSHDGRIFPRHPALESLTYSSDIFPSVKHHHISPRFVPLLSDKQRVSTTTYPRRSLSSVG